MTRVTRFSQLLFLTLLFTAFTFTTASAQNCAIFNGYAIVNGSFYNLNGAGNPNFQGQDFGDFVNNGTLNLGGQSGFWSDFSGVTYVRIAYRIYPTGVPAGSFTDIDYVFQDYSAPDDRWGTDISGVNLTDQSVNILDGTLLPGNYTLEVYAYGRANNTCQRFDNNSSNPTNYTATFDVYAAPNVTTNAATAVTASSAQLNGFVDPQNNTATSITFEYGTSPTLAGATSINGAPSASPGTASTLTIAALGGLTASTTYYYRVNATNAAGTTNGSILSFTTGSATAASPTVGASGLNFTTIGAQRMTLNWTNGDGANRVVVAKAGAGAFSGTPLDGTAYTANTAFGSGDIVGLNEYVVYNSNGSNVTVTGLTAGLTYNFAVYEYNGTGVLINYYEAGVASATQATFTYFPTAASGSWTSTATWVDQVVPSGVDVGIGAGHVVPLTGTTMIDNLTVFSGGLLLGSNRVIQISDGGSINVNAGGSISLAAALVVFTGNATVSGTITFGDVSLQSGGVDFGASSTINADLTVNAGGFVNTNPPSYGSSSTLRYNTGNTAGSPYGRGVEWSSTSGAGYPNSVFIQSGTFVNLSNGAPGVAREIADALIILGAGGLFMDFGADDMTASLTVGGNLLVSGTLSLSNVAGGDLILNGSLNSINGTINTNDRAVTFSGGTAQGLTGPANRLNFDFLFVSGASTVLTINSGNLTVDDRLELTGTGEIDMNDQDLVLTGADLDATNGTFTAGTGDVIFEGESNVIGTVVFNDAIAQSNSGLGTDFGNGTSTVNGTLIINAGGYLETGRAPNYGPASTLNYNTGGTYTASNGEWYENTFAPNPGGVPQDVLISNNTTVTFGAVGFAREIAGDMTIDGGSTLQLSSTPGGDLYLKGDFNSAGTFDPQNREVQFNGTVTQNIGNAVAFDYLRLAPSALVSVGAATSVNNRVAVENGATLTTNSNLTLEDGAVLLHGVGTQDALANPTEGTVVGTVIVKRIGSSSGGVFNYWGTPVSGANTGTLGGNIFSYNETANNPDYLDDWTPAAGTMVPGVGYISTGVGTANFNGTAGNGGINVTVTRTASANTPEDGWNLIANPYASGLDANEFITTNTGQLDGSIYLWDDDLSGGAGYTSSDYAVWNGAGSVGGGGNTPNGFIGSGQGFFVLKSATGSGTVTFENSMRAESNTQFFKQADEVERFKLSVSNAAGLYNETLVAFKDDATAAKDKLYDAVKLKGSEDIALYTMLNNEPFAIQAFGDLTKPVTVDLGVDVAADGQYTFDVVNTDNLSSTQLVLLEDTENGTFQNLMSNPVYTFNILAGEHVGRFKLHFRPGLTNAIQDATCSNDDGMFTVLNPSGLAWNMNINDSEGNQVFSSTDLALNNSINTLVPGTYEVTYEYMGYTVTEDFTITGLPGVTASFIPSAEILEVGEQIIFTNNSIGNATLEWDLGDGTVRTMFNEVYYQYDEPGVYIVELTVITAEGCISTFTHDLEVIAKTATGIENAATNGINIFSTGAQVVVDLSSSDWADATVSVYNALGQQLLLQSVNTAERNVLDVEQATNGIYIVNITNGKETISRKVGLTR